jgi:hypothetical protein
LATFFRKFGWSLLALTGLLQACAEKPPAPRVSTTRLFAADMAGGAKQCTASKPALKDGQESTATIQVANNGGWCAIHVTRDGKPYAAGLLIAPASHGTVFIHPVGDDTRIDYTPETGFAGADSFVVRLLPGDPTIRVAVTVSR